MTLIRYVSFLHGLFVILRSFYALHCGCILWFCAAAGPAYVLKTHVWDWALSFDSLSTDHSELHAPLPAQVPCGLRGPAQGQREVRRGELQNLRFWGDPLHGRHSLPEPPGECARRKPAAATGCALCFHCADAECDLRRI